MRANFAILSCFISAGLCFAQSSARENDEAPIREIVSKYVDARERIDPKAVEALFTSDADQLVSSGEWRKGRDAVVRGRWPVHAARGKRTITVELVRFVTSDVAIADGRLNSPACRAGDPEYVGNTHHEEGQRRVAHYGDSQHAARNPRHR
jgi:ketosteroid isomerase-like protein